MFVSFRKSRTFASLLGNDIQNARGIAQLVAFLVWDQAVACSSHAAPTK